jgi:hypothetical protein
VLRGRFGRNGKTTLGPNPQMVETILTRGPNGTLDDKAYVFTMLPPFPVGSQTSLAAPVSSVGGQGYAPFSPEMCEGLCSSLMLLITHNALRVKHDSEVWQKLGALMSREEVASLQRTQQIQAMRKSWIPFRRWFLKRVGPG